MADYREFEIRNPQQQLLINIQDELGLEIADMYHLLGVERSTYNHWIRGNRKPPKVALTAAMMLKFIADNDLGLEWRKKNMRLWIDEEKKYDVEIRGIGGGWKSYEPSPSLTVDEFFEKFPDATCVNKNNTEPPIRIFYGNNQWIRMVVDLPEDLK